MLSVLYVISKDNTARYSTDHAARQAVNSEDVFKHMLGHFMTTARKDMLTTGWNKLSFVEMRLKHGNKGTFQTLDALLQCEKYLQYILGNAYQSPLLLWGCISKVVKSKPLYVPLMEGPISLDSNVLHTRLHEYIRGQEKEIGNTLNVSSPVPAPSNHTFHADQKTSLTTKAQCTWITTTEASHSLGSSLCEDIFLSLHQIIVVLMIIFNRVY